ncbi:MAG: hypothetical protein DRO46_04065 [Candidatus Hecatellales archaeon]|nr:MAG: hypothetical protein DRO46_04065 [Candidatus Hecatellales archaeon]
MAWNDACEMRDVTVSEIEENYKTPIVVTGWVYGVRDGYLIIVNEKTFYGYRVLAIPLGTITKIRILTRKPSRKILRVSRPRGGLPVKVVYVYVKPPKA